MTEPWFDPSSYSWIAGTAYGTSLGLFGGLVGTLAPAGKARTFCFAAMGVFFAIAMVFVVLSIVALCTGQPYGIWYGFGLPGILGLILCPTLFPVMRQRYREAEERRMQAVDLGGARR